MFLRIGHDCVLRQRTMLCHAYFGFLWSHTMLQILQKAPPLYIQTGRWII